MIDPNDLNSNDHLTAMAFWPQDIALETDRPRRTGLARATRSVNVQVETYKKALDRLVAAENVSIGTSLLAGFTILLMRWARQTEIAGPLHLQTNCSGFSWPGRSTGAQMVLRNSDSFRTLLQKIDQGAKDLGSVSSRDHAPETALPSEAHGTVGFYYRDRVHDGIRPGVELALCVTGAGDDLQAQLHFDPDLFDASTIEQMIRQFYEVLSQADDARDIANIDLDILCQEDLLQLKLWQDAPLGRVSEACLHELISQQAKITPDATALVLDDHCLSYRELDDLSDRLAHRLHTLGIGPELPVGLCVERSIAMVIGMLGIIKAGGAYIPLDPRHPTRALLAVLEDSLPSVILTHPPTRDVINIAIASSSLTSCVIDLDEIALWPAPPSPAAFVTVTPANALYVIYTSGSTGRPKGVVNEHRGVVNKLQWMQATFPLTAADAVLQKTAFTFDVSVWEIFWPLLAGARLVLARPDGHKDAEYLSDLVRRESITVIHFVPAMLRAFLEVASVETCPSLTMMACSGEALAPGIVQRHRERFPDLAIHNLYGPTEASIEVTWWPTRPNDRIGQSIPIGHPITNVQIYILDENMRRVPPGAPGEIHIGGVAVARGYLNRSDLTKERFVPNPFVRGERLYKTGDLGRYRPDGAILFLGRNDFQIKVRGFRVEPGEIEAKLEEHPDVHAAVVLAREDGSGERSLVAYTVSDLSAKTLRAHLEPRLPAYMLPSAYVNLTSLPVSPSGKIDRQALPAPGAASDDRNAGPRTATERAVVRIWSDILGLEHIGLDDDFFEHGGHSLTAMRMISRMRSDLDAVIALRDIFEHPTVAELAALIDHPTERVICPIPLQ